MREAKINLPPSLRSQKVGGKLHPEITIRSGCDFREGNYPFTIHIRR